MVNTKTFGELYDRAFHLIREEVMKTMRREAAAADG
jgi:hypothetical protein